MKTQTRGMKKSTKSISKMDILKLMGLTSKKKSEKPGEKLQLRSVNMDYIDSNLYENHDVNQFHKNGIRDQNFIDMINDCKKDILTFKQIRFLPSTLIHKKDKTPKLLPFDGAPSFKSFTSRKRSNGNMGSNTSQTVDSLIKKYRSGSKIERRRSIMISKPEKKQPVKKGTKKNLL